MKIRDRYPITKRPEHFDPSRFQPDETKFCPVLVTEPEELVAYLRMGGCTAGCGACCEAFVVPIRLADLTDSDFEPTSHGQIILPIERSMLDSTGCKDWEYWLTLHEAYLFQMPSGLLALTVPIEPKSNPHELPDSWSVWLEEHGIALIQAPGQRLNAYVPLSCTQLTKDGTCSVHGTPQHPALCASFPMHPQEVAGLDFCTYRFHPIRQEEARLLMVSPKPRIGKRKKRNKGRRRR